MQDLALLNAYNSKDIEDVSLKVINSGYIASGEYVAQFESGLSKLLNQEHVVTTSDMTSAINLALHMSDVRANDEVLTTSFACMATNSPIAAIGAKAVWIDLEPHSIFLDPEKFEQSITDKTKAAIVYHVAGYPGHIKIISDICRKHNITLIEDCDNALLAKVDGQYVGSFGDFAVFSFYPNRQINTFEGGALVCKSALAANKARKLRRFGIDFSTFRNIEGGINPLSDIPEVGWSISLNNLCSAAGSVQIETVETRIGASRANAIFLRSKLSAHAGIHVIKPLEGTNPAYWVFLIRVEKRDEVIKKLKLQGIHSSTLHYRNDQYSCFQTEASSELPNTKKLQESILALPCGWWLKEKDLNRIVSVLFEAISLSKSIEIEL